MIFWSSANENLKWSWLWVNGEFYYERNEALVMGTRLCVPTIEELIREILYEAHNSAFTMFMIAPKCIVPCVIIVCDQEWKEMLLSLYLGARFFNKWRKKIRIVRTFTTFTYSWVEMGTHHNELFYLSFPILRGDKTIFGWLLIGLQSLHTFYPLIKLILLKGLLSHL